MSASAKLFLRPIDAPSAHTGAQVLLRSRFSLHQLILSRPFRPFQSSLNGVQERSPPVNVPRQGVFNIQSSVYEASPPLSRRSLPPPASSFPQSRQFCELRSTGLRIPKPMQADLCRCEPTSCRRNRCKTLHLMTPQTQIQTGDRWRGTYSTRSGR